MIYRLARKATLSLRHRFVAEGSAIMLIGPYGQRAILDIADAVVIADNANMSGTWGDFLSDLTRDAGCKMQVVRDEPEEDINLTPY